MADLSIFDVLKVAGLSETDPNVELGDIFFVLHGSKLTYTVKILGNVLFADVRRTLTRVPNYQLLNTLNNHINIGTHKVDKNTYFFEFVTRVNGLDRSSGELQIYIDYVRRQAAQGFEIMNTSSEKKRSLLLEAHAHNRETE